MALRTAHGSYKDALVVVETRPVDELSALNGADTVRGITVEKESRTDLGRFKRGNKVAAGRKPALASAAGIPVEAKDPRYTQSLRWARKYRAQRVRELTIQHGGYLSSGVCAMLTSSALDMAASRYLTILAAEGAPDGPTLLKTASQLAASSRQQELTALEIAQREAAARPKKPFDPLA